MKPSILSAAFAAALLVTTAASALSPDMAARIKTAAGHAEAFQVKELIAKAGGNPIEAYMLAVEAAGAAAPRNPGGVGRIALQASNAAVAGFAESPADSIKLGLKVGTQAGLWSGQSPATALSLANDLSDLARKAVRASPNEAVQLIILAARIGGPAAAGGSGGKKIAENAEAIANGFKATSPQTAMQINGELRKAKLHK